MKILMFVFVLLVAFSAVASASIGDIYFAQDDFKLTWTNGLGSIGSAIYAKGDLAYANGNVLGSFTLSGAQNTAVVDLGWGYKTVYDATLTLEDDFSNVLWSGTGSIDMSVNKAGGPLFPVFFDATGFDHPADWSLGEGSLHGPYAENFRSIGHGFFGTKMGGSWTDSAISVPWVGTYNWRYTQGSTIESGQQHGNLQGKLNCVPEPMSVMLGLLGLSSVAGFCKLRRK